MAIKINCYIVSLKLCLPAIKLAKDKSINHLKKAIHDKATTSLINAKPSDLLLYQVKPLIDIVHTHNIDADVESLFFNGKPIKEKLKPLRVISSRLSLHPQNLHIVVQVPQIVPPATPQVTLPTTPHISLPAVPQNAPPTVQDVHNINLSAKLPSYSVGVKESDNHNHIDDNAKADDNFQGEVSPNLKTSLLTTNSVIVDLPALANRVKINMSRKLPLDNGASDPVHLLATTSFIAAGRFGQVFNAVLPRPAGGYETGLVIKLARQGCERELVTEAEAYTRVGDLAGRVSPVFYGLFTGTFGQSSYSILVLSYGGESLLSFDDLAKSARLSILLKLYHIHLAGIQLNDMKPDNVVENINVPGYYLIDFSVAWTDHQCPGITKCHGLLSDMAQLQISGDDCTEAGLA